jgi:hypothetical protein
MSKRVFWSLLVLCVLTTPALAFEVYINGQPYRGTIKNRAIQGATLQFDAQGNLTIDAPTLRPATASAKAEPIASGPGIFLVVNNVQTNQYMVKASVNGTKVLIVRANQKQGLMKIEHLLKPGKNAVDLTYYPDPDAEGVAGAVAVEVLVGRGTESKTGLLLKEVFGKQEHQSGNRGAEMKSFTVEIPESE